MGAARACSARRCSPELCLWPFCVNDLQTSKTTKLERKTIFETPLPLELHPFLERRNGQGERNWRYMGMVALASEKEKGVLYSHQVTVLLRK